MAMTEAKTTIPDVAKGFLDGSQKKMLIGSDWVDAASGKTFPTLDPATGDTLADVPFAGPEDVDRAVKVAREAFEKGSWRDMPPAQKARVLVKVAELIEEHTDELATIEVLDQGKPKFMATGEMGMCAETFRYYAGWPTKLTGQVLPSAPDKHMYVRREPVGVCGQITPWNFPMVMASWKIAPALACGNTCVLKPAEQTPLTAIRLGEILLEAGVPEGVVNILQGDGSTGASIVEHPDVDKIAFTGSTEVGKKIQKSAADTLKHVSLELGGKSPNVVFADADMGQAVSNAMLGCFINSGQICTAGTRLLLEESIHDEFLDQLKTYTEGLQVGPGLEEGTMVGPLVSDEQLERVKGYLELGPQEGAEAITGGSVREGPGYFVEPTIFSGVDNSMRIAQEEIFGPVLSVIPFKDLDDAAQKGNETIYGLASAIWTTDLTKAHKLAAEIKAGTVWVNCYNEFDPVAPFGGFKQSGYGREFGEASLDLYTQLKTVQMKLL